MSSNNKSIWSPQIGVGALVAAGVLVWACAVPNATQNMKKMLERYGSIDAEWEVRDEDAGKTYTYALLRSESGVHELYVIEAADGKRAVTRDLIGGIDGTGCYLLEPALTTPWVAQLPEEALRETTKSGEKTRTKCLEYKEGPAWAFIPEADRKAAQPPPPPPPPKPTMSPDAGTADGGAATEAQPATPDKGDVESAIP